jgi:molybdopterin-synthase adenylyltransferase
MVAFQYEEAFSRNLGWLTREEQNLLRDKRVAIAGLGGVGGVHLTTLARLGVGRFTLADFDSFDLANINRQAGAALSSLGRPKTEVLANMARDINPEVELQIFADGVHAANIDRFLSGVDLYVDGLDFFAFAARELVFGACHARGIPATTVAPLGMSAALLNFVPGGMSFEEYFRLKDASDAEKPVRFLLGLAPSRLHLSYLADPSFIDLGRQRGPSTAMACQLCAGVAATEALKILLRRGPILAAPHGLQFDAYRNQMVRTWRPWGNANPLQRVMIWLARRQLLALTEAGRAPSL